MQENVETFWKLYRLYMTLFKDLGHPALRRIKIFAPAPAPDQAPKSFDPARGCAHTFFQLCYLRIYWKPIRIRGSRQMKKLINFSLRF